MRRRIAAGGDLHPWLVADDGAVAGYAYAAAFRARPAYRFAVETSVYVAADRAKAGVGGLLYARLIELLIAQNFVHAIAAITEPNPASTRFHERFGFARSGCYRDVGYKLGGWRSVGLWQRRLAEPADPPAEPIPLSALAQRR